MSDVFEEKLNEAKEFIQDVKEDVKEKVDEIIDNVDKKIDEVVDKVEQEIKEEKIKISAKIKAFIKNTWTKFVSWLQKKIVDRAIYLNKDIVILELGKKDSENIEWLQKKRNFSIVNTPIIKVENSDIANFTGFDCKTIKAKSKGKTRVVYSVELNNNYALLKFIDVLVV